MDNIIIQAEAQIDQVFEYLGQRCLPIITEFVKKSPENWDSRDKEGISVISKRSKTIRRK